jgi:4-amino-4-deoxy-L-arabinose transferase-like glycosyltransferase
MNDFARSSMDLKQLVLRWVDVAVVLCIGLVMNCQLLGEGPLAGTEGNRALTADQMLHNGNWLLPKLYDQYYLMKPPLDYWILAGMEKLTGRADELIWRLPSAIAGAAMAAFFCAITARWYGRLAGWVSGVGCCGMLALWAQNHTAELDALNSLATVVAACLIIDMGFGPKRGGWGRAIAAGLAFAAMLLLKGPAGYAAVLGALVGPAVANRTKAALKQPWPWIALGIGAGIFITYLAAAAAEIRRGNIEIPESGFHEIGLLLSWDHIDDFLVAPFEPLVALVYMLPVSLLLPAAIHPSVWNATRGEAWSETDRRMLRALVGTLAGACVFTMIAGLVKPRYSYTWFPMISPIAGAVAAAWQRKVYPLRENEWINIAMAISGIICAVTAVVLASLCAIRGGGHEGELWVTAIAAVLVASCVILWLNRNRTGWAGIALVALILLAGRTFAIQGVMDRNRRSMRPIWEALAARVPPGETVTTGHIILDHPEIFYYAHVNVESHPDTFAGSVELPTSRWVLLNWGEYQAWSAAVGDRLTHVEQIRIRSNSVALIWYIARGNGG